MSDQLSADLASLKIPRDVDPDRPGPLRYALISAAILGAGALAYFVGYPYVEARVFKTEVAVTEISLVSPAQAAIELTSTGYVVPQVLSKVSVKVAGRVLRVTVKERDTVKAGQVLAQLDDSLQRSAISAARTRVLAARARAETARANLLETEQQAVRARTLAQRGVSPAASAVDLEARANALGAAVKAADADVKAAEAEVETLTLNLQHTTVTAPIDGTVISKPPEVGEWALPQSPLLELADFSSLVVETDVPEGRLSKVQQGGPCEIVLDAFPGRRSRGRVREISPRVNRAKATVVVKVGFVDAAEGVLPDMSARVSFLSGELDAEKVKEAPRLLVPGPALAERDGAKVVFTLNEDRVRMVPVQVGPRLGGGFELVQGPPPGTRVVKDPPGRLFDGQRIKEKTD